MKLPYRAKDISGITFNMLTAFTPSHVSGGHVVWKCYCLCGNVVFVRNGNLQSGGVKSCGCARNKHGLSNTPEYRVWDAMIQRCTNPSNKAYASYGGRGISVCARWLDAKSFLIDMGNRPTPDHSIDRINNNLGYMPNNCQWTTRKVQQSNMRSNHWITFNGHTRILSDWAERINLKPHSLLWRLNNWPLERALTEPPNN